MTRRTKPSYGITLLAFIVLGGLGATRAANAQTVPGAPADPKQDRTNALEEVVVTARKVEESLQRVPVSVAVITAADLVARSLDNLSDIGQTTPNFSFTEAGGPLGRGAGVAFMRGVGQTTPTIDFETAVGIYLDGIYLGRAQGNDVDMLEVERVELLRGPQGTLFGKNTSGGAVNIITQPPDAAAQAASGNAQISGGSFNRLDVLGGVNLPLATDKAALRLNVLRRSQDGYGERANGEDLGSLDRWGGRGSLLLTPTDKFSALLSFDGVTYDETNTAAKLIAVNTAAPLVAFINATTTPPYDERWLSPSDFVNFGTGFNSSRGDVWGTSLTLELDSDWALFKSISSYRAIKIHTDQDPDLSPIDYFDFAYLTEQHQLSQEFQLTGRSLGERLDWVFGVYYFRESAEEGFQANVALVLFPACNFCIAQQFIGLNESYAAYGQGNYNFTERLSATVGVRYTHDRKELQTDTFGFPGPVLQGSTGNQGHSWNDVSPRLGLEYQWTPDIMTYVSAAQGYKGGGFNRRSFSIPTGSNPQYDPETVLNYELGLRSEFFEGRVRLNATAFYNDYEDLQMQIGGATTDSNGNSVPFGKTANIPKVRITGGELELTVVAAKGLTLTGGLGLTDAEYKELPTDAQWLAAQPVTEDNSWPNTPEVSYTLGAEYTMLLSSALSATGRVDYAHKSAIHYSLTDDPLLRQPAYGLLDARLTFEHEPTGLSFSVFGTNLTDEHYFTGGLTHLPDFGFAFVNMARPREWGVSAQVRF